MSNEPTAGATQADATATTPAQAATTTTTDTQAVKSQEDYERMIAELRKENASHRTKLKSFEDAQAAADLAKLGDLEKAQKQAADAQKQIQQYKTELVNAQVRLAAKDKGIIDPDLAALALQNKLEFGDDGMPSNLDKALDDLIKAKPYLVPATGEGQPASTAQTAQRAPNMPAMSPNAGRSSISTQSSPLKPGQRVTFHDLTWKK